MKRFFYFPIIVTLLIGAFLIWHFLYVPRYATTAEFRSMAQKTIKITNAQKKIIPIRVHVADEKHELLAGYQWIGKEIIGSTAILFDFKKEFSGQFHMRNVRAELDIAFFDNQGKLIDITVMQPGEKLYGPGKPFRYALEMRAGGLREKQIKPPSNIHL